MKLSKTLVIPLVGILLVGAAGAVMATSEHLFAAASGTTVAPAAEPPPEPRAHPGGPPSPTSRTTDAHGRPGRPGRQGHHHRGPGAGDPRRADGRADQAPQGHRRSKMDAQGAGAAAQGLPGRRRDHARTSSTSSRRTARSASSPHDGRRQDHDRRAQVDRPGLRLRARPRLRVRPLWRVRKGLRPPQERRFTRTEPRDGRLTSLPRTHDDPPVTAGHLLVCRSRDRSSIVAP